MPFGGTPRTSTVSCFVMDFDSPVKAQPVPWPIVLQVSFPRRRPVERNMLRNSGGCAQLPAHFHALAYRIGHSTHDEIDRSIATIDEAKVEANRS